MSVSTSIQLVSAAPGLPAFAGAIAAIRPAFTGAMGWVEEYMLVLVIGGLLAGIGIASISQPVVDQVDSTINTFMGVYGYVAPWRSS